MSSAANGEVSAFDKGKSECFLVTGAGGEIGSALLAKLAAEGNTVVAFDLNPPRSTPAPGVTWITGDITDRAALEQLGEACRFTTIFHLAALLSTSGERNPEIAHRVNVEGSLNVFSLALKSYCSQTGESAKVIFPSTIAAYGMPTAAEKKRAGAVREEQYLAPITMYGCNKLYVENLGRYFSRHYRLLDGDGAPRIDFRALRFPGLISADTVPTGGTSDYGPEMLHAAAQGKAYECFVEAHAALPFMTMPDAVRALMMVAQADRERLTQTVYNVSAFSLSAEEFRSQVRRFFPGAEISFVPHAQRASIVASWPADVDDSAARRDWGWAPKHDRGTAFSEYLVPGISRRYCESGPAERACVHQ